MHTLTLEWLHPDGRVGGRWQGGDDDGRAQWLDTGLLGSVLEDTPQGLRLLQDGPSIVAGCPHSTSNQGRCGGCDLDRWPADVRQNALTATVARAYRIPDPAFVPSPTPTGTRGRIKLAVVNGRVGYFVPRSHDFVPVERCPIARPEVEEALVRLTQVELPEGLESVEIRSDGTRAVFAFRRARGAKTVHLPQLGDAAIDGKAVQGSPTLTLPHVGRDLRASPNSFFQVHLALNPRLVAHVCDAVMQASPERVLDLYAGIGNFTIPIAVQGVPIEAVELEGQATADLRATAHDLKNVMVTTTKAERFDPQACPFDVAVMDPPRAGAGVVMERVLKSRPKRVVHVACDPVAGARDVSKAIKAGYTIADVTCFDLFPQTHHVETVTVLDR